MEDNKENLKTEEIGVTVVKDFGALAQKSQTKTDIFTNISDQKKIFNLDSKVDSLLNDCEGELIRVKEVLIKRYEKPMKEPIIDDETGEIVKDKEITYATILIDDNDKSYATGSKIFSIQLMKYLQMFGINENGFEIKIVKNKQTTGNKALGFELV